MTRESTTPLRHMILVVEDDPGTRKMVRVLLQSEGYDVAEAASGGEAISRAGARLPDLVLQDLGLPDMQGTALARALRGLAGKRRMPIIAFSSLDTALRDARAADVGFAAFLLKPVEATRLVTTIQTCLGPDSQSGPR